MKKTLLALTVIPLTAFFWFLLYLLREFFYHYLGWGDVAFVICDTIYWIYGLGLMVFVFYLFSTEQIDKKLVASKTKLKKRALWLIGTEMFVSVNALFAFGINQPTMGPPFPYFPQVLFAYTAMTPFVLLAALIKSIIEHIRKKKKEGSL